MAAERQEESGEEAAFSPYEEEEVDQQVDHVVAGCSCRDGDSHQCLKLLQQRQAQREMTTCS
jgi:hypothetical protein